MEYYSPIQRNRIVSFAEIWMDLQTVILSMYCILYVLILYINAYMQNLEKLYRWTYLQSWSRDTDIESKYMDTKAGKGGSGSNSKSEIGVYTLLFME